MCGLIVMWTLRFTWEKAMGEIRSHEISLGALDFFNFAGPEVMVPRFLEKFLL